MSSLKECLFGSSAIFISDFGVLLLSRSSQYLLYMSSWYILDISPDQTYDLQIFFSNSLDCLFILCRNLSVWYGPTGLFLLLLSLLLLSNPKTQHQHWCQRVYHLCLFLGVLWINFSVWFKIVVVSFSCMWPSSSPNPISWRDDPFPIVYSWLPCCKLIDLMCVTVLPGSQFCSIDPCLFLCHIILFWLL